MKMRESKFYYSPSKTLCMLETTNQPPPMKKKRRIIPTFRLSMKDGAKIEQIYNHPRIKEIVLDGLVEAIKDGISKNKHQVALWQVEGSEFNIEIPKEEWIKSLKTALCFFVENEEFEKCYEISEVIKKLS